MGVAFIAWAGIRRFGRVTFAQLVGGGNWNRAYNFFLDLGIALGVLVVSLALGTLLKELLGRFESSSEFVFRGYLQNQLTAFTGNVTVASILQILLFRPGSLFSDQLLGVTILNTPCYDCNVGGFCGFPKFQMPASEATIPFFWPTI